MKSILLADDDAEIVTVQQTLLEALGYEVRMALTPADTLRELRRLPPDLIIVDLRLPRAIDGRNLIREIRDTGFQLPVIAVSGWPDDLYGTPEEDMVTRVLVKGNIRELVGTIAELLAVAH